VRNIPEPLERKKLVIETHEELVHRGTGAVYYKLKAKWYWPRMGKVIDQVIRKCEVCNINNRKKQGGSGFATTTWKLGKVGVDLAEIQEGGNYILVMIDYSRGF
jgi:hypothetical protein